MNLPKVQHDNIDSFFNKEEIVLETIEQIMKDFIMFGLEITFSGDLSNAYNEIQEQLVQKIEYLYNTNVTKLYAILYQIDISNKDIEKAHDNLSHLSLLEVVSHQIITRDLQKVLTRRYFKSKK